jgi:predicted chitinase
MLAYILGSISYDSDDFRRTTENLTYKSADQIKKSQWRGRIALVNDQNKREVPPLPEVDFATLPNSPENFAEVVWGWRHNWFGNNFRNEIYDPTMKDGWKYRARGVYQLVGREQFEKASGWLGRTSPIFDKSLLVSEPDALWNRTVSARVAFAHFIYWKSPRDRASDGDARTKARRERGLFSKSLAEVLAEHRADFRSARLNQIDMGSGDEAELNDVEARSKMFRDCIKDAPLKP